MRKKLLLLTLLLLVGTGIFLFHDASSGISAYALSRRIPKVTALILTGFSIASASLIFQTVSENRILTPSVLGLDSLYVFIQTALLFFGGATLQEKSSGSGEFLFSVLLMGLFSVLLLRTVLKKVQGNLYRMLLVGIVLGTLLRSASSYLQAILDPNEFLILQGQLFASFNNINTRVLTLAAGLILLCLFIISRHVQELDVLSLGRDNAVNLGVAYPVLVQRMLLLSAVLIGVSTALVGPITFLGILVTNLARELLKTYRHRILLWGSMLISAAALVLGQFLVEQVFNFNTPISVMINFVGGLYFIFLLIRENRL
ncbi:iron chelate uptake ABC transporter family permease subunit [Proteiniclasticum sp. BAD-10]|uniref:Iron chelate uptake ABC transporter family permease subunit n=1 Tax=Proteiniclasticum sediminis TaxID=2804028 RepID=A0A941CQ40_9CLOT|nr:iron chelate uptake ABC transporter family permease subunit [Proteiniclasticum sediminis]MBR0575328.1 iron chelate uptake ABC transporter family permease subunit [Proteiniclasticum sediminis]